MPDGTPTPTMALLFLRYQDGRQELVQPVDATFDVARAVAAKADQLRALNATYVVQALPAAAPEWRVAGPTPEVEAQARARQDWRYGYLTAAERTRLAANVLTSDPTTAVMRVDAALTDLGARGSATWFCGTETAMAVRYVSELARALLRTCADLRAEVVAERQQVEWTRRAWEAERATWESMRGPTPSPLRDGSDGAPTAATPSAPGDPASLLTECADAIETAILSEDGLDGATGAALISRIRLWLTLSRVVG